MSDFIQGDLRFHIVKNSSPRFVQILSGRKILAEITMEESKRHSREIRRFDGLPTTALISLRTKNPQLIVRAIRFALGLEQKKWLHQQFGVRSYIAVTRNTALIKWLARFHPLSIHDGGEAIARQVLARQEEKGSRNTARKYRDLPFHLIHAPFSFSENDSDPAAHRRMMSLMTGNADMDVHEKLGNHDALASTHGITEREVLPQGVRMRRKSGPRIPRRKPGH